MIRSRIALAVALTAVALPLHAQTLTINNITPTWSNIQPGNVTNLQVDNSGSVVGLSWGNPTTQSGQSAFRFNDRATSFNVTLSSGLGRFVLGDFVHENNPITGNFLSSARLNVTVGINGTSPTSFSNTFLINHEETPNGGPCPYGTAALNANGCADRVTFGGALTANAFTYNSQQYFITLLGFSSSSSSFQGTGEFLSKEQSSNKAYLWAEISTRNPNVVPEPSTYALMATGLAGLMGVARRRRATAAK